MDQSKFDTVREEVKKELLILADVYDHGRRESNMWHKGLICLAFKLAHVGAMDDAESILAMFPVDAKYFRDVMPVQMKEDTAFSEVVIALCMVLVTAGIVQIEYKQDFPAITQFEVGKA